MREFDRVRICARGIRRFAKTGQRGEDEGGCAFSFSYAGFIPARMGGLVSHAPQFLHLGCRASAL